MTVGTLDRKSLYMLIGGLAVIAILRFGVYGGSDTAAVGATDSIPQAEQRLQRVRQIAAMLPGKEAVLKQAAGELAVREKGLLVAATVPQAQAQLLNIIQRLAAQNGFSAPGEETMNSKPLANDYGEVSVGVVFNCSIDQLVNFLAAIGNEPQLLATNEINISGGNDKKKLIQVRLNLSGVVAKKVLPVKKTGSTF